MGLNIRVLWFSSVVTLAAIGLAGIPAAGGPTSADVTLERLASAYRKSPNAKDRAALLHFAADNNRNQNGALARLALARVELDQGRPGDAIQYLDRADSRLAQVADYLLFLKGMAYYQTKDYTKSAGAGIELLRDFPDSPLRTDAAIITAKAFLEDKKSDEAIRILKTGGLKPRQPEFDFLLGKAYLDRADMALAAAHLQQVESKFPARKEAADASILLGQIRSRLGAAYPPSTGQDLLSRAESLRSAKRYPDAQSAVSEAIPQLAGAEKEKAQVMIGGLLYDRQQTTAAQKLLSELSVKSPEADAERLYYLVQCARRLKQESAMLQHARVLAQKYPQSVWTMDAHRWAGNYYILDNDRTKFVPLFNTCAEAQPRNPESAYCHWKVAWDAYLQKKPEAHEMMAAHLQRYPHSDKYAAALLFLGRRAERDRRLAAARAYYQEVSTVEPMSYYAELANESLRGSLLKGITPDAELVSLLAEFRGKPLRQNFRDLKPLPATKRAMDRAQLLAKLDFMDWVELELRSYDADIQQRQLVAMELASIYQARGDNFRALRTMKSMAPGYFRLRPEEAPQKFWELLFPMPYPDALAKHSRDRSLDAYLVAGLIRQESEYRPDAVSPVKAYGLMQVMPATGRSLARSLGLGPFSVGMLVRPEINLNMGTYYLANLGKSFDGRYEYALASYNAGKSRADRWKTWAEFDEPIEFIETIPFTETREYVLSVFRNAMVYRAVYPNLANTPSRLVPARAESPAATASPAPEPKPASASKPAAAKASTAKPSSPKASTATAKSGSAKSATKSGTAKSSTARKPAQKRSTTKKKQ